MDGSVIGEEADEREVPRKTPRSPVRRERQHKKYSDAIMELYDAKCDLCGKRGADTIDHVVPVAWGGSDHPSNLVPACRSCNSSKGAARPERKWYREPSKWLPGYGPNVSGLVHVPMLPWIPIPAAIIVALMGMSLWWLGGDMSIPVVRNVGAWLVLLPIAVNLCVTAVWLLLCWRATRHVRGMVTIRGEDWIRYELERKEERSRGIG